MKLFSLLLVILSALVSFAQASWTGYWTWDAVNRRWIWTWVWAPPSEGWSSGVSDEIPPKPEEVGPVSLGTVVGAALGALMFVAVIVGVVAAVIIRRRRAAQALVASQDTIEMATA